MIRSACLCLWVTGVLIHGMCGPARPDTFLYAGRDAVYGEVETTRARAGDSLIEVARQFDIGYNAIVEANPGLDPYSPGEGAGVVIPAGWLLPDTGHTTGIVVNLSEYRLYYFYTSGRDRFVATFPVSIGDEGWATPLGEFKVAGRAERPHWTPPPSMRTEDPTLPVSMASGIENPMGSHALRLSRASVLIHGTNRPFGIGRRVSHGCIHLYPEDIPLLYAHVQKGTRVNIVRQPVKIGSQGGRVYLQAHRDGEFKGDPFEEATRLLRKKGLAAMVNMERIKAAVHDPTGVPVDVTEVDRPDIHVEGTKSAGR